MLGIIFLREGQNSTCSHWQQCVYLSRSSHWSWACCTKKLFSSTYGVKIFEKYLWRCTFSSKVACWRPATLHFTLSFKSFTKVLTVFQFYFDILLHSNCQALHAVPPRFPTGVENMGGGGGCAPHLGRALQNLMGGLSQYMGENGGLKMLS